MADLIDDPLGRAKTAIKMAVDAAANGEKIIAEFLEKEAVWIEGMSRSIQIDRYSCGAQCAFMVLKRFGKARNIEAVENELGTTSEGTTEEAIIYLMRKRGLTVSIFRRSSPHVKPVRSIERHIKKDAPVIAYMKTRTEDHWVVVYGYSYTSFLILDPSPKNTLGVKISRARFRRRWSGYGMAISNSGSRTNLRRHSRK
jgi:ABC-type bacteriocin/lantibiotic exporter with double-glycine peptidase domain